MTPVEEICLENWEDEIFKNPGEKCTLRPGWGEDSNQYLVLAQPVIWNNVFDLKVMKLKYWAITPLVYFSFNNIEQALDAQKEGVGSVKDVLN